MPLLSVTEVGATAPEEMNTAKLEPPLAAEVTELVVGFIELANPWAETPIPRAMLCVPHGCTNGVPASQRALAGRPEQEPPHPFGSCTEEFSGVNVGQGYAFPLAPAAV